MATGLYVAGSVLLVAAGVAKLRQPAGAGRALAAIGIRVPGAAIAAGGAAELGLGATALVVSGPVAPAAVACCYAALAGVVAVALRRGAGVSCGCFGETAAPLGPSHLLVNLAVAGAALAVAHGGGVPAVSPLGRAAIDVLGVALAWVVYLVLVPLPRLLETVRVSRP